MLYIYNVINLFYFEYTVITHFSQSISVPRQRKFLHFENTLQQGTLIMKINEVFGLHFMFNGSISRPYDSFSFYLKYVLH